MNYLSLAFLFLALPLHAELEPWEEPPVNYSATPARDRLSQLAAQWQQDPSSLPGATALERVRSVLAALQVPEASQILVFSKTSMQNERITPANPRALYFSSDSYCAYVPGGLMEIAVQDPVLGPVFYTIDLGNPSRPPQVTRDASECLTCHATARTSQAPGLLVRSVFPAENGRPLLALGSRTTDHQTPVPDRWGGYYVTGSISQPHLGNRTYTATAPTPPQSFAWPDLVGKIDTSKYLRTTSDVAALMVLEHQCHAHNLLTAASLNYRRAVYLAQPVGRPDQGAAGRVANSAAAQIVDWFLFRGEAEQGPDGVEGDAAFQRQFEATIPHTPAGESLAEFQLNGRIFKHRCSYMIYSAAFRGLPAAVKSRVITGLKKVLEASSSADDFPTLKLPERQKITRILTQTAAW